MFGINEQTIRSIAKRIPSRDRLEIIRAVALMLEAEGDDEGATVLSIVAEIMFDLRVALRGGAREVKASRHYVEE